MAIDGPITNTLNYPAAGLTVNWRKKNGVLIAEYLGDIPEDQLLECVKEFGTSLAATLHEALQMKAAGIVVDIVGFHWNLKMEAGPLNAGTMELMVGSGLPLAVVVRNAQEQMDHTRKLTEKMAFLFGEGDETIDDWIADPKAV